MSRGCILNAVAISLGRDLAKPIAKRAAGPLGPALPFLRGGAATEAFGTRRDSYPSQKMSRLRLFFLTFFFLTFFFLTYYCESVTF
jgi:hypothetical protein